jgi:modification methylase
MSDLPLNSILHGDCIEVCNQLPEDSIDLIFADPPYNLQLNKELYRPNLTRVNPVDDDWDQFASFQTYDRFSEEWLRACQRVLKPTGTIWVIGSYHNIFRIGKLMQDLGFWILNDVLWIKTNPMPNFRGVRFTNAHETLIWASMGENASYTFNHHAMKGLNHDKQMRSDWWLLPLATGGERLKDENGEKAHSTQKPEALLYRVILSSSDPEDVILDPFFGSGTTGAVAKKLHRHWIGIEKEKKYIPLAQKRVDAVQPIPLDRATFDVRSRKERVQRVPFSTLLEQGYFTPGETVYFRKDQDRTATIKPNADLRTQDGFEGSIHQAGKHLANGTSCNGWEHWYVEREGDMLKLDHFREAYRQAHDMYDIYD